MQLRRPQLSSVGYFLSGISTCLALLEGAEQLAGLSNGMLTYILEKCMSTGKLNIVLRIIKFTLLMKYAS